MACTTVLRAVARHASLPAGTYDVRAFWSKGADRATNARYVVVDAGGRVLGRRQVDQRSAGDEWRLIGTYAFTDGKHRVEVDNARTDGVVVADAVLFGRR